MPSSRDDQQRVAGREFVVAHAVARRGICLGVLAARQRLDRFGRDLLSVVPRVASMVFRNRKPDRLRWR